MSKAKPSLAAIALIIARDANLTFGGGTATSEVLRRSFVKRGWITDEQHRQLFALSRLTPGTNLLAYCAALGWVTRGTAGAMAAWLASSLPSSVATVIATEAYERLETSGSMRVIVLLGMSVAVVLLASSAWHLAKPYLSSRAAARSSILMIIAIALSMFDLTPIRVLLITAVVGATWPRQA